MGEMLGTCRGRRSFTHSMTFSKWLPLLAVAALAGCGQTPEDRLVGIWTLDQKDLQLPPIPFPGAEAKVRSLTQFMRLKLLSDRQFVLTFDGMFEGKWSLENGKVRLQPTVGGKPSGPKSIIYAKVGPDGRTLIVHKNTPIGAIDLPLRKTG